MATKKERFLICLGELFFTLPLKWSSFECPGKLKYNLNNVEHLISLLGIIYLSKCATKKKLTPKALFKWRKQIALWELTEVTQSCWRVVDMLVGQREEIHPLPPWDPSFPKLKFHFWKKHSLLFRRNKTNFCRICRISLNECKLNPADVSTERCNYMANADKCIPYFTFWIPPKQNLN